MAALGWQNFIKISFSFNHLQLVHMSLHVENVLRVNLLNNEPEKRFLEYSIENPEC